MSFPKWLRITLTFCGTFTILFSVFYIVWATYNGQFFSQLLRCAIFFSMILGGFWFFAKLLFYSVTATERGLETDNILGSNKLFLWDEIVEIRRPRFGVPYDATYVISKNKAKLLLVKSMNNYSELIDVINVRAVNLRPYRSSGDVEGKSVGVE
jgi:hypothetical protein